MPLTASCVGAEKQRQAEGRCTGVLGMKKAGPEWVRLMAQFCCVVASVSRVSAAPEGDALHPSVSMVRPEAGMKKADPVGVGFWAHTLDASRAYCRNGQACNYRDPGSRLSSGSSGGWLLKRESRRATSRRRYSARNGPLCTYTVPFTLTASTPEPM